MKNILIIIIIFIAWPAYSGTIYGGGEGVIYGKGYLGPKPGDDPIPAEDIEPVVDQTPEEIPTIIEVVETPEDGEPIVTDIPLVDIHEEVLANEEMEPDVIDATQDECVDCGEPQPDEIIVPDEIPGTPGDSIDPKEAEEQLFTQDEPLTAPADPPVVQEAQAAVPQDGGGGGSSGGCFITSTIGKIEGGF